MAFALKNQIDSGYNPICGVLITGAPSLAYTVQYAATYELVMNTNTDNIPLR